MGRTREQAAPMMRSNRAEQHTKRECKDGEKQGDATCSCKMTCRSPNRAKRVLVSALDRGTSGMAGNNC